MVKEILVLKSTCIYLMFQTLQNQALKGQLTQGSLSKYFITHARYHKAGCFCGCITLGFSQNKYINIFCFFNFCGFLHYIDHNIGQRERTPLTVILWKASQNDFGLMTLSAVLSHFVNGLGGAKDQKSVQMK